MADIVLLSAIYGDYDESKPAPPGVDAVFLTDRAQEVTGWDVRVVDLPLAPEMAAKWWKLHPWEAVDADVVIWIDGSLTVTVDDYVDRCLVALGDDDLSLMRHAERDCIYDEAVFATAVGWGRGRWDLIGQAGSYRPHPEHWGLFATGNFVVRPARVRELFDDWWHECEHWGPMCQLSLPPLLRASGVRWNANLPWRSWWNYTHHKQ